MKSTKYILLAAALTACLSLQSAANIMAQEKQYSAPVTDTIFTSVDVMPVPPFEVNQYLAKNIRYPHLARKKDIQGRVEIQFVVEKDGSLTNMAALKEIGGGCGQEVIRVLKNMPPWTPGTINGQAVRAYYTVPVSFKMMK